MPSSPNHFQDFSAQIATETGLEIKFPFRLDKKRGTAEAHPTKKYIYIGKAFFSDVFLHQTLKIKLERATENEYCISDLDTSKQSLVILGW